MQHTTPQHQHHEAGWAEGTRHQHVPDRSRHVDRMQHTLDRVLEVLTLDLLIAFMHLCLTAIAVFGLFGIASHGG